MVRFNEKMVNVVIECPLRYLEEGFSGIQNVALALTSYEHIDKDWCFSKMEDTFF